MKDVKSKDERIAELEATLGTLIDELRDTRHALEIIASSARDIKELVSKAKKAERESRHVLAKCVYSIDQE